jgi:hypothetical protein
MKQFLVTLLALSMLGSTSIAMNPPFMVMITNFDGEGFNLIPNEESNPLAHGNLIHLILDVENNGMALPVPDGDRLGYPSGDDQLIAEFNLESYGGVDQEGAFLYAMTVGINDDLVSPGDNVYIRAFNSNELTEETYYCNSEYPYEIPGFDDPILMGITFPESMGDLITPGNDRELSVLLTTGWNIISINVRPGDGMWEGEDGPDINLMTEQLRGEERHHLELMKDEDGRFYLPAFGFNNIPYWDLTEGYQMKVDQDLEAIWAGEPIAPDADIPLEVLWNLIAYFPTYELDASSPDFYVLSPIIDQVAMAKDNDGNFMLPAFNFSNMPPWQETQGYQVKIESDEPIVLNYPEEQREVALISVSNSPDDQTKHWNSPVATGINYSVLVTEITGMATNQGDQIAAFDSENRLAGVGEIDNVGVCGLAVWGDDSSTDQVDGLSDGETFCLRLWDSSINKVINLDIEDILAGSGTIFSADEYSVLGLRRQLEIPNDYYLAQNHPNPFNSVTQIRFGLPESGEVFIKVFDISGRMVTKLASGNFEAGHHLIVWNAEDVVAGLYLVRITTGDFRDVKKMVLVK